MITDVPGMTSMAMATTGKFPGTGCRKMRIPLPSAETLLWSSAAIVATQGWRDPIGFAEPIRLTERAVVRPLQI